MKKRVLLYKPKIEDLYFREMMLKDEETMAYNHAYGGTISFSKDLWEDWYDYWLNASDKERFYRYVVVDDRFVGEVGYHYSDGKYIVNLIIYAPCRNKGYGFRALELLCDVAKKNGISTLYDNIAIDNKAVSLFIKSGFNVVDKTKDVILVKMDL